MNRSKSGSIFLLSIILLHSPLTEDLIIYLTLIYLVIFCSIHIILLMCICFYNLPKKPQCKIGREQISFQGQDFNSEALDITTVCLFVFPGFSFIFLFICLFVLPNYHSRKLIVFQHFYSPLSRSYSVEVILFSRLCSFF